MGIGTLRKNLLRDNTIFTNIYELHGRPVYLTDILTGNRVINYNFKDLLTQKHIKWTVSINLLINNSLTTGIYHLINITKVLKVLDLTYDEIVVMYGI